MLLYLIYCKRDVLFSPYIFFLNVIQGRYSIALYIGSGEGELLYFLYFIVICILEADNMQLDGRYLLCGKP